MRRRGKMKSEESGKTPKALANVSPELERSDNSGIAQYKRELTLKGFRRERNPFKVVTAVVISDRRVVATLQLWADISQRLRRYSQAKSERVRRYCLYQ